MAYDRAKFFWGAIDIVHSDESPYTPAQTHPMGENALPPGIGVRKAMLVYSRLLHTPPQDQMTTHIDFLNVTAGSPDDTWTDADFAFLEGEIVNFQQLIAPQIHTKTVLDQIRWYRVGPGIVPPNPAVRILEVNTPGTSGTQGAAQVAATITLKTVPRRQWGRMYLPVAGNMIAGADGRFSQTAVQAVADAANLMFTNAAANEFLPVIFSKSRGKAYGIESLTVDNVPDVIRSRRFNEATFKATHP